MLLNNNTPRENEMKVQMKLMKLKRVMQALWSKNPHFIPKIQRICYLPKNVNFAKNEYLKMWISWKMNFWKCEFCQNWDSQNVIFWINWGFLPQCALISKKYFYRIIGGAEIQIFELQLDNSQFYYQSCIQRLDCPKGLVLSLANPLKASLRGATCS